MKRYHSLLAVGILTLVSGVLASVALFLAVIAGISLGGALVAIQLIFCAMMLLYPLFSLLVDDMLENKKRSLAAWGLTLCTALAGSVLMSSRLMFHDFNIIFIFGYFILAFACIVFTNDRIGGKGNWTIYMLTTILTLVYPPMSSFVIFALDRPAGMMPFILPIVLMFGACIVMDLIYYRARLKQTNKD